MSVYRGTGLFILPILLPRSNSSILRHLVSSYLSPVKRAPSCPSRFDSARSGEPSSTSTPSPTSDNRQSELLTHPRRRPSGSSRARSSSSTTSARRLCTCRVANMNYSLSDIDAMSRRNRASSESMSTIVNRQGCKASTCVHDAMPRPAQELDLRPWRQAPTSNIDEECKDLRPTPKVQGSASKDTT